MSLIKSPQDLAAIRVAGRKLASILAMAKKKVTIGMTTDELDQYITECITKEGVKSSFMSYEGYPKASCLSVNEQVVHGIPGPRVLKEGDVVGIDVGIWYQNVCVDGAVSVSLGEPDAEVKRLLEYTEKALEAGIKAAKPYRRVGSISQAIQEVAEEQGFGIVRSLTGHGVGHQVHEAPEVPNTGRIGDGILLKPGMVLAIEPMFTLGEGDVFTEVDGWGVVTADKSISAHFEHTVIITNKGAEIVTKTLA